MNLEENAIKESKIFSLSDQFLFSLSPVQVSGDERRPRRRERGAPRHDSSDNKKKQIRNDRGKQMNFRKISMIGFALVATSFATSAAFAQSGGTPQITPILKVAPDISVKI